MQKTGPVCLGRSIWLLRKEGLCDGNVGLRLTVSVLPIVLFTALFLAYPVIYSVALSFRDATIDTFVARHAFLMTGQPISKLVHSPSGEPC